MNFDFTAPVDCGGGVTLELTGDANWNTKLRIDWGDGSIIENKDKWNLTHNYNDIGSYDIKVSCVLRDGCQPIQLTKTVIYENVRSANLIAEQTDVKLDCPKVGYKFTPTIPDPSQISWTINGQDPNFDFNPTVLTRHLWSVGTHGIGISAVGSDGCLYEDEVFVTVNPCCPSSDLDFTGSYDCEGLFTFG